MSPPNSCNQSRRKRRRKKKSTGGDEASSLPSTIPPEGAPHPPPEPGEEAHTREETAGREGDEAQTLAWLAEAFESFTVEDVNSALKEARGDACRAAEILGALSERLRPEPPRRAPQQQQPKKKKGPVASTGIVADLIGKGYARGGSSGGLKRGNSLEQKQLKESRRRAEAEEFLSSMLGESCELDASVIHDVLGNCGYDIEMALNELLDMSTCSFEQLRSFRSDSQNLENSQHFELPQDFFHFEVDSSVDSCIFTDSTSQSSSNSSEKEHEFPTSVSYGCRPNTDANDISIDSFTKDSKKGLQNKVLESLFGIPDCSDHEPQHMNWKNVVKKLESFGQGYELCPEPAEKTKAMTVKSDSYHAFRSVARQHWDTMKSYYQKAGEAHSKREHAQAAYFSVEGKRFCKLAREADEKASLDIFQARNKNIRNITTIDLHGQHVKQAIDLVKLHLLISTYSPSNQLLKVITGSGAQGTGRVKQSVIRLLNREGLQWKFDNPGTLLVQIDAFREYSFVKSDEDSDGTEL